ncbi:amino acid ABC transporter substrate-binding protein [Lichenibacterium ramalinae]|uniref:Amino acid ABC transporter substrate-binding protein n=1 Tax=Lichenibacterium ramalinae TaxID=2316527 RepID=A0A4V1RIR3_9HYPH|nr:amino acid ABC transporter substrate-binding protein [Lichenibacterium ramalinae]RYB05182.1 amino acid ABC transporter substrate-binding protein [Lichenibacterium ramalinae]
MNRLSIAASCAALLCWPAMPAAAEDNPKAAGAADLHIVYLSRQNDAAYQPVRAENGVTVPTLPDPSPGADLAIRDTRATARAVDLTVTLDRRAWPEGAPIDGAADEIARSGAVAVIADVPRDDLVAFAKAAPKTLAVFDVRQHDDDLRTGFCELPLFHLLPSFAMETDALAEFIVQKNWRRAFVLYGPAAADKHLADDFAASARKFGAKLVAAKQFAIGNDPRRRDDIDVSLMTSSDDYDVVFLADTGGDFGRFVPWQLSRPRPVIGTEGLRTSAWDALAERFGAPQVNHRFARLAKRDMNDGDWAVWAAVRSVVEAAIRKGARDATAIEKSLAEDQTPVDVSKGIESSFRPWDHQFRQAVMLRSADAVVAYAPFEPFLHRRTPLDTLGVDLEESPCRPQ